MIGNTLAHYRIVRQIGAGGMGVVYLARDQRLEREVAIKVLPPGTLADEATRKRFRREALTLSKLNHPNIAMIFDFDTVDHTDFLVTEYISGVTLDAKLAEGALPAKEVVALGIQLAQGLAAAHAEGVVHRDLKPANLRLTADGRLKILDFGLAQLVQPDNDLARTVSLTSSQQITGTLPYMAPEQLRGEAIDSRSDIWATGVVLYEMATGKRPFRETNGPLLINAILNLEPEPPSVLNPGVKPGLENVILKALHKNPVERYQSSRDLDADLERITTGILPLARPRSHKSIRWPTALAAALLLLAAGMAGYFYARRPHSAVPAQTAGTPVNVRRSVAVLGFKNLSGREDTAWLSTALAEMLTTELAAGEKLLTISGENVARVKSDLTLPQTDTLAPDTLARVRKNLGSDFVVLGSYLDIGNGEPSDQIRLDVRLQDATAGQTVATISAKGTLAQLDELVTNAGLQLRTQLGVGGVEVSDEVAAKAAAPSNLRAARLYAQGLEKLRHYDELAARDLLVKAVAADPKHAPTRAALSAAWVALGHDGKAREVAKQAFDLSEGLPRQERLRVEAQFYETDKQWEKAIAAYRNLFQYAPDNLEYGLDLCRVLTNASKPNDALTVIATLRQLPSPRRDDLRIDLAESRAVHFLSDFQRERDMARKIAAQGAQSGARAVVGRARQAECSALRNLGDPKGAIAACQEAQRIFAAAGDKFGVAVSLNNIGNATYDLGDLPGARKVYEDALRINREIGNERGVAGALDNIASVAGDQGDSATAKKLSQQALAIYRETGDKINIAATLNNIAAELVLEGNLSGSQAAFEEALAIGREIGSETAIATALTNIGDLRLELGDPEEAKKAYAESLATFQKNGEKGKSSNPLIGMGDVLYAMGDLAGARNNYDQALAITRETGEKHVAAMAHSGIGKILMEQDDLAGGRAQFEDALGLRKELGEKDATAASQVDIAQLNMESGRVMDAATALPKLIDEIHAQKMLDDEAAARAVFAQVLLRQDKLPEARKQVETAKALSMKTQRRAIRLEVQIATARVLAASGSIANLKQAVTMLRETTEEAGRVKFVGLQLESQLALAEIELKMGGDGRSRLSALEKSASDKGFLRIARQAAAVAKAASARN